MTQIVFKRNNTVGNIGAEADKEFLENCFVETPEYKDLIDFNNNNMILLGRTGTGKTALLKKLKNEVDIFIEISPSTFAFEYINNVPFVSRLKQEGINLDVFYKFLWLHEITSKIIKNYFENTSTLSLIEQFKSRITDDKKLNKLKSYLEKYEGVFFEEDFPEHVTEELQKKIQTSLGHDIAKVSGEINDIQKREIQTSASKYVNQNQINELQNIIEIIKQFFEKNYQRKLIISIDNLDENWIEEESKYKLINALLYTIRFYTDIKSLKVIIAMRADLLNKTCEVTKRQNEKDDAFTIKLHWNRLMIRDLINKRIEYLFKHKYTKQNVTFEEIFDCNINSIKAYNYILDRTMMRPRDIISFVNLCIKEADGTAKITEEHVLKAEKKFRTDRLDALKHEWANIYNELELYIKAIYEVGNEFNFLKAKQNIENIESILYSAEFTNDYLIKKYLSAKKGDKYNSEKNIKELINILFQVGVLGIKDINGIIEYSTPEKTKLNELDFIDDLNLVIHPLFKKW